MGWRWYGSNFVRPLTYWILFSCRWKVVNGWEPSFEFVSLQLEMEVYLYVGQTRYLLTSPVYCFIVYQKGRALGKKHGDRYFNTSVLNLNTGKPNRIFKLWWKGRRKRGKGGSCLVCKNKAFKERPKIGRLI